MSHFSTASARASFSFSPISALLIGVTPPYVRFMTFRPEIQFKTLTVFSVSIDLFSLIENRKMPFDDIFSQ